MLLSNQEIQMLSCHHKLSNWNTSIVKNIKKWVSHSDSLQYQVKFETSSFW